MKVRRFDPSGDLIKVTARVFGPRSHRRVTLAFDTAATLTHLTPDVIDELGYSAAQGEGITTVRSAIGSEPGYLLRIQRFLCLGFRFDNFLVHVHDLPIGYGIDGLLGLSFLRRFNYEIRSREGRILAELVT